MLPKPLAHHLEAVAEHLAFEYQDSSPLSFYDSESKLITDRLMEAFTVSLLDGKGREVDIYRFALKRVFAQRIH